MFCRKLKITDRSGMEVGTTPMLVPSISSRVNADPANLLATVSEIVDGPLLVSAYDLAGMDACRITFPSLIFVDSGGYECNRDNDVTDIGFYKPQPMDWDLKSYITEIDRWNSDKPTVLISYDHPKERKELGLQIQDAIALFKDRPTCLREFLVKPETDNSTRVRLDSIKDHVSEFSSFDIIGFTEKELGHSLLDRMKNIALIRRTLDEHSPRMPIHIFGSLDTITTPLYFMAGADIFDGLSWLRFLYDKGNTYYLDSHGPRLFDPSVNVRKIWIQSVFHNIMYLKTLEMDLGKFVSTKDFEIFEDNAVFFKKTYDYFLETLGG